jgi:hypothetical protein
VAAQADRVLQIRDGRLSSAEQPALRAQH